MKTTARKARQKNKVGKEEREKERIEPLELNERRGGRVYSQVKNKER